MVLSDDEVAAMDDMELIQIVWELFGVAIDYSTQREEILKSLRGLSS